ncbi:MAG: hypothetical protein R8M45_02440 [Ghiorsea sp.]
MGSGQIGKGRSKRDQWRKIIDDFQDSGCKTQVAYCQQLGVSTKSFARWRKVFACKPLRKGTTTGFVKVSVQPVSGVESGLRINFSNDMHIAVAAGFDVDTLQRVLRAFK